ncbi:copper chaperone PCu(A)C [Rhodanobacter sp. DHB23]|uniref:copper chaperone PCu(A)C n=1 Tax=Rhodanobacter sp. DHB23 TaxID=2775923 RepID=UPI0017830392|nr:copper chaperone PCu(A)C [Rhodanobacter sp. DHB23]MBD8871710.1 copper chaperone PCu(A)C [Rhodanobacter sp. DHB23]
MKRAAVLLAGLLGIGLAHAGATARIDASHAWIRVLPGTLPAGAYVVLRNDGDQPVALTGADSPAYGMAMLHRSTQAGGNSRMAMVDALTIPAHGTQALAPGGYHLMLMDAKHPVRPGDTVRITLRFDDGDTLPVDFIARPASALGDQGQP